MRNDSLWIREKLIKFGVNVEHTLDIKIFIVSLVVD